MKLALRVALLCVIATPLAARHAVVSVSGGETLETISLRYYGNAGLAASLRTHNSLPGEPTAGSVIEIPLADEHLIAEGEDWTALATRYWGDWELADAMPALVKPPHAALEPGTTLQIPALIQHRVQRGESLAVLSRRSYGNAERALAIAALNGIDDPNRLRAGQQLRLPVFGELAAGSRVTRVASPPPQAPDAAASSDLGRALSDAIEAYHQGEFSEARSALGTLRLPLLESGSIAQRRALLEHLLLVHAAFDDQDLACQSLGELRGYLEDPALDPELFSPKVLELSASCP